MRGLFNYDGWLVQSLCKITDALFLGVLWIVFSIPLITAGASASALYYAVYKVLRKDGGGVWSVFWSAFRSNLKQSSILWGIIVIAGSIMLAGCYYGYALLLAGVLEELFLIVLCVFAVLVFAWLCYLLPYTSRFNASIGEMWRSCSPTKRPAVWASLPPRPACPISVNKEKYHVL